jgi:antibiotic biosynthesis monooxygenase (ABM) superfamily enzyme
MEQKSPRKWKMMLVTWLFVYPVINILTVILVPLMGVIVPKLHKRFADWIIR